VAGAGQAQEGDSELSEDKMVETMKGGMRFLGLISLADPPRQEVRPWGNRTGGCHSTGVEPW
jgi:magnesium-transporting ATPase (P-type)